jgi:F0F1-type ATP synthase delta subunit
MEIITKEIKDKKICDICKKQEAITNYILRASDTLNVFIIPTCPTCYNHLDKDLKAITIKNIASSIDLSEKQVRRIVNETK